MIAVSTVSVLMVSTFVIGSGPISPPPVQVDTACIVQNAGYVNRTSPLDSISFQVSGHLVKICYGRPSTRGRTMIGGSAVPYGTLWRTGANEPTMIHTTLPLNIAGLEVPPGIYSLYTVPGKNAWQIVVNRSTSQWGRENRYTPEIEAQEIGRGSVASAQVDDHVETFMIRAESSGNVATVFLEWEHTRVQIPLSAISM